MVKLHEVSKKKPNPKVSKAKPRPLSMQDDLWNDAVEKAARQGYTPSQYIQILVRNDLLKGEPLYPIDIRRPENL